MITVAGRGLPGAEEVLSAGWIEMRAPRGPTEASLERACEGLGAGERGAILLAKSLTADLTLLDDWKARRVAQGAGLSVAGSLALLETGTRKGLVPDLRAAYMDLLRQGVRFDLKLLQDSLIRLGLPKLQS
jgi:predicted nucleic acid-binding protein